MNRFFFFPSHLHSLGSLEYMNLFCLSCAPLFIHRSSLLSIWDAIFHPKRVLLLDSLVVVCIYHFGTLLASPLLVSGKQERIQLLSCHLIRHSENSLLIILSPFPPRWKDEKRRRMSFSLTRSTQSFIWFSASILPVDCISLPFTEAFSVYCWT